jgi:NADPH:quinone reductase-like Zn-dependent oxidoreductase
MVRILSTSLSSRAHQLLLAVDARSVVTVRSRNATTVLSVKGTKSVLTMPYQSDVGLIGFRERALVAQGRPMMKKNLPQGADVAVLRQLIKQLVGLMA